MLPAERGDVGEQIVENVDANRAEMLDRAVEVEGVSERHRGRCQRQPGRAVPLVLERAVAQLAQSVEENGARERVAGLALVEDETGAASLLGIVESVEHEQGALDPPDLAQRAGDRVLARITHQLAEHGRRTHRTRPDRGDQPQ